MTKLSFSCDHCGAVVALNDVRCPSCGKVFDAVRCPRCGHQGPPSAFSNGCPRCRYLASPRIGSSDDARLGRKKPLFVPAMTVLLVLLALAASLAWILRRG